MKQISLKILATAAIVVGACALPTISGGQEVIRHVYMNRASVRLMIKDVERQSNEFRELYEQRYKRMFLSDFRKSDDTRKAIQDLDKALEVADRKAGFHKPQYVRDNVEFALSKARVVNRMFRDPDQVLVTMGDEWHDLKTTLNQLAQVYELPGI
jgi:hypothetical protein